MSCAAVSTRRLVALAALAAAGLLLALSGCSDSSGPDSPGEDLGGAVLSGDLDPGQGSMLLKRLDQTVPGQAPILVELIGSNLRVDAALEIVSIDVVIRNAGAEALYAPAMIWLSGLRPDGVRVLNADVVPGPPDTTGAASPPSRYGFDYSELLGGDPVLAPQESSETKTWRFHVPGLTGFSFGARAEFGMVPDLPRIAGRCFEDVDRDGRPDANEGAVMGLVGASGPDGFAMTAVTDAGGRYAIPVTASGLYSVNFIPLLPVDPLARYARPRFSTPNPLSVLLTPGPDGRPGSYLDAHFGVYYTTGSDSLPPVIRWDAPFDSLASDGYIFQEGRVTGLVMRLRVGFSGCQPDHPLALYWQVGPEASPLPVAHLRLAHDDLGEMCDAFWTRDLAFDLLPIRRTMGTSGLIILVLDTPDGQSHRFELGPLGPDAR